MKELADVILAIIVAGGVPHVLAGVYLIKKSFHCTREVRDNFRYGIICYVIASGLFYTIGAQSDNIVDKISHTKWAFGFALNSWRIPLLPFPILIASWYYALKVYSCVVPSERKRTVDVVTHAFFWIALIITVLVILIEIIGVVNLFSNDGNQ